MAEIKYLKTPKSKEVLTPQCCVPVTEFWESFAKHYRERRLARAKEAGLDPEYCQRRSTIEIDGKPYCAKHAGPIAIRILVEGK